MKPQKYSLYHEAFDFFNRKYFHSPAQKRFISIASKILPESSAVIDAGGGCGNFTRILLDERPDLHLTFIEPSQEMMSHAREKLGDWPKYIAEPIQHCIQEMTGKDGIIFMRSLYAVYDTLEEFKIFFKEIFSRLNPAGYLLIYERSSNTNVDVAEINYASIANTEGVTEDFNRLWPIQKKFLIDASLDFEKNRDIYLSDVFLDSALQEAGFQKVALWNRIFVYRKCSDGKPLRSMCMNEYHYFTQNGNTFFLNLQTQGIFKIHEKLAVKIDALRDNPESRFQDDALLKIAGTLELFDQFPSAQKIDFFPAHLMLNVSQECNLSCIYCYGQDGGYGSDGMMDETTAIKSIDWLFANSQEHQPLKITFFGGEPLLNYSLIQTITLYARAKSRELGRHVNFSITTNGTLLNDATLAFFKEHEIRPNLSYDGPLQDKQRPFKSGVLSGAVLQKKIALIRSYYGNNFKITASIADMDVNIHELKNTFLATGCERPHIRRASPANLYDDNADTPRLNELLKSDAFIWKFIADLKIETPDIITRIKERKIFANSDILKYLNLLIARLKLKYYCGAGKRLFAVAVNGDIYPCHRFNGLDTYKMGSVHRGIESELTQFYIGLESEKTEPCSSCWCRYFCGSGCLYDSFDGSGKKINPPESLCELTKETVKSAIIIFSELDENDKQHVKRMLKMDTFDP